MNNDYNLHNKIYHILPIHQMFQSQSHNDHSYSEWQGPTEMTDCLKSYKGRNRKDLRESKQINCKCVYFAKNLTVLARTTKVSGVVMSSLYELLTG